MGGAYVVLKIFLNHATEDKALVMPYYNKLKAIGFEPWIDKRILPGQDWDETIQRHFNAADVYLIFMTPRSVVKRGYVQREIKDALDKQRHLLPGDIGLIPLMLEECEVPDIISQAHQYVRLPTGWHEVVESLELAAQQRSIAINKGVEIGPFRMFRRHQIDEWEGWPGYDINLIYPHIESSRLPNTALELNELFSSLWMSHVLNARDARTCQDEGRFAGWSDHRDWKPRNSFDYYLSPGLVSESILSISIHETGMHAGAAHGYVWIESYNFLILDDGLFKLRFGDFLSDAYLAYRPITEIVRRRIEQEVRERTEQEPDEKDLEIIREALLPREETFERFLITPAGFTLLYPEGTIFSHALGALFADLTFDELREWLKPDGPHKLAQTAVVASWDSESSTVEK